MDTENRVIMAGLAAWLVHQRFIRWQRNGIWKKLFEIFKGNKKFEWLMTDSIYIKNHQHSFGDRRGNQSISKTDGGLIRKYIFCKWIYGMPVNFIVTDRSRADCKDAIHLIKNINAKLVFVHRTDDKNKILSYLN